MAIEHKEQPAGHEHRDANVKWLFGIVAFLFLSGIAIEFILAHVLDSWKHKPPSVDRWHPAEHAAQPAPFPRLQLSPPADLLAFRAREEAELNSYGWINRTSGVVRIPIDRAIDLVLQKGLPVRNGTNGAQAGPSSYQLIQQRLPRQEPETQGEK